MPAPMTKNVAATAMPTVVAVLRPATSGTDAVTVKGGTDTGTSDWLTGELVDTEGLTVTSAGSEKLQTADGVARLGGEAN